MQRSIVLEKAIAFALRIVKVYRHLKDEKGEYVLSKELLLSSAYIVKHVKSALHSKQGRFSDDMSLALYKALDAELWLTLLNEGKWLTDAQHESLNIDCVELIKMTSSISKTAGTNDQNDSK